MGGPHRGGEKGLERTKTLPFRDRGGGKKGNLKIRQKKALKKKQKTAFAGSAGGRTIGETRRLL